MNGLFVFAYTCLYTALLLLLFETHTRKRCRNERKKQYKLYHEHRHNNRCKHMYRTLSISNNPSFTRKYLQNNSTKETENSECSCVQHIYTFTHNLWVLLRTIALSLEHKVPTIYLKRPSALCLYHSLNHNVLTMYTEKHCNWLSQLLLVICSSRITVICAANSPVGLPFVWLIGQQTFGFLGNISTTFDLFFSLKKMPFSVFFVGVRTHFFDNNHIIVPPVY